MSRLSTSFVLGYHGCSRDVAERIVCGKQLIRQSTNTYDWLGHGSYFWESDPDRAKEWAEKTDVESPAVVGAVIDLGNCLNLMSREGVSLLREAYESYVGFRTRIGMNIVENRDPRKGAGSDRLLRYLDNAVIEHLHKIIDKNGTLDRFDTVRGIFPEGEDVYPGAGFRDKSHIQIAVCNPDCIKGYFWPLNTA